MGKERWAPWSEDEKARVKSGSYLRGTIRQVKKELEAKYNEGGVGTRLGDNHNIGNMIVTRVHRSTPKLTVFIIVTSILCRWFRV